MAAFILVATSLMPLKIVRARNGTGAGTPTELRDLHVQAGIRLLLYSNFIIVIILVLNFIGDVRFGPSFKLIRTVFVYGALQAKDFIGLSGAIDNECCNAAYLSGRLALGNGCFSCLRPRPSLLRCSFLFAFNRIFPF